MGFTWRFMGLADYVFLGFITLLILWVSLTKYYAPSYKELQGCMDLQVGTRRVIRGILGEMGVSRAQR